MNLCRISAPFDLDFLLPCGTTWKNLLIGDTFFPKAHSSWDSLIKFYVYCNLRVKIYHLPQMLTDKLPNYWPHVEVCHHCYHHFMTFSSRSFPLISHWWPQLLHSWFLCKTNTEQQATYVCGGCRWDQHSHTVQAVCTSRLLGRSYQARTPPHIHILRHTLKSNSHTKSTEAYS